MKCEEAGDLGQPGELKLPLCAGSKEGPNHKGLSLGKGDDEKARNLKKRPQSKSECNLTV